MNLKAFLLKHAPVPVQNLAITTYNTWQYLLRHGGAYRNLRAYYAAYEGCPEAVWRAEQQRRLGELLHHATARSAWYRGYDPTSLSSFPVLTKPDLVNHLEAIATIPESQAIVSLTGGTTGASLKVLYTKRDQQDRYAVLDHFRAKYGYTLGKPTGWFSGKSLARPQDLARGSVYRDDWISRIRFFSTFHISPQNFDAYWDALVDFAPEYLVGFPSSVADLCALGRQRGRVYPHKVKTFFPTAETVLPMHHEVIGEMLGCDLVDQYATSEGAPFILECPHRRLHIHPLTGIFEVVDEAGNPAREGEILVTSFSTYGTPLIRYRVGDRIGLAPQGERCSCGSTYPLVEHIQGRTTDYIYSRENGRVNLGNLSNCTKDAKGILLFQILQEVEEAITVKVVGTPAFNKTEQESFVRAIEERVGSQMAIALELVEEIPREKSGKFRIVKNSLAR